MEIFVIIFQTVFLKDLLINVIFFLNVKNLK